MKKRRLFAAQLFQEPVHILRGLRDGSHSLPIGVTDLAILDAGSTGQLPDSELDVRSRKSFSDLH
jgi:hypothetical protein